ncbi:MAG: glycosyltransferase [Clostridia bacterium]|nr:glycosyltransferase [Clostridia bacterium]
MLLSVVVPFYHVEKYFGACLEQLALLPKDECEILLVDDCGTDRCAEIAAAFCRENSHARVIRREKNGGLSAARNTGFDQAGGEYVYYLDSDDIPLPDALMSLVRDAKAENLDLAKARFVFFDDVTGKRTPGPAIEKTGVVTGGELFAAQCQRGLYEPMVWQCVYRTAFLRGIGLRMADGLQFEDELFQAPALLRAQRTAAFDKEILLYRQRAGSIMGSFSKSSKWCANYLEVCRRLSAICREAEKGAPCSALQKRIGQIALSVVKNITAYRLPESIAREAMAFACLHKREIGGYAFASGDLLVALQGLLVCISPAVFARLYSRR